MPEDKELIRRALLGDPEAQKCCTKKEIVLPCPFCGNEYPAITSVQGYGIEIKCHHCNITFRIDSYSYGGIKEVCQLMNLRAWNARPAPQVGRCGECKHCVGVGKNQALRCTLNSFGVEFGLDFITSKSFCSYFEPKEE